MPISQQILFNSLLNRHESRKKYLKFAVLNLLREGNGYTTKEINLELRNSGFDLNEHTIQATFSELWKEKLVISVNLSGANYYLRP